MSTANLDAVRVFTLGEVAKVLQMPKSRVKNWTIGRPLRVMPRILAAHGTGSRNLYSIEDVYVMGFIKQLGDDGFSSQTLKQLLDILDGNIRKPGQFVKDISFFVLTQEKGKLQFAFQVGRAAWDEVAQREKGVRSKYVLDVRSLVTQIDERVERLRGRR